MQNYLRNCEAKVFKIIRVVRREADRKNLKVYLVGGVVRDLILKRKNFDLDMIVQGNAIDFARDLAGGLGLRLITHGRFGTSTLAWENGVRLDLATARKEFYPRPGTLPVVSQGTIHDDLSRRDFTINTLAIVISKDGYGQLIDELEGLADLKNKKIRVLHDQSFTDDPTRILRAIRFEQRFHFAIEPKTLTLLKKAIDRGVMARVTPQRYFQELKKILMEPEPHRSLRRLMQLKALTWIDPLLKIDLRLIDSLRDGLDRVKKQLRFSEDDQRWLIYFMGLVEKPDLQIRRRILERFPFKRDEKKSILQVSELPCILGTLSRRDLTASGVYRLLKPFHKETVLYFRLRAKSTMICQRIDRFLNKDINTTLHIDGNDLERMGFPAGPKVGEVLDKILDQKIDGRLSSKKDETTLALSLL